MFYNKLTSVIVLLLILKLSNAETIISMDGRCGNIGSDVYMCRESFCCSTFGWCGNSNIHCVSSCVSEFGVCGEEYALGTSNPVVTSNSVADPNTSNVQNSTNNPTDADVLNTAYKIVKKYKGQSRKVKQIKYYLKFVIDRKLKIRKDMLDVIIEFNETASTIKKSNDLREKIIETYNIIHGMIRQTGNGESSTNSIQSSATNSPPEKITSSIIETSTTKIVDPTTSKISSTVEITTKKTITKTTTSKISSVNVTSTIRKTTTTTKKTTTTTNSEETGTTVKPSGSRYVIGYWNDWENTKYPISSIKFDKLTHINYAFANIDPASIEITFDTGLLSNLAKEAAKHNVKVLLSLGGWYGSKYFTEITADDSKLKKLVANCKSIVENYKIAGIDIDWEYPGTEGACNNPDKANDVKQYIELLNQLREALGKDSLITMAVSAKPFKVNDQFTNLKGIADVVDFINIMDYDFNGAWSPKAMHHANLKSPVSGEYSIEDSVETWKNAGFDTRMMVIGIPAYGKSFKVTSSSNYGIGQDNTRERIKGDNEDSNAAWVNLCGQTESDYSGSWKYKNIRNTILKEDYKTPVSPWERYYDSKYESPVLFNKETMIMISYDDPQSLQAKMDFVKSKNLLGTMVWDLENDTDDYELISVMNQ